ncbi:MAG: signal peptidase I [Planctomycetota bacterium]|nr:MAG: signal peptidase I [Planctomycetota bacterium]
MNETPVQYDVSSCGPPAIVLIIYLAVVVLMIVSLWKVFGKAGQPGWACLVPIYNVIVMLQVANKPLWWIVLFFVPIANIIIPIMVNIAIAEKFGKGAGFGIGLSFLGFIFLPILAFGNAQCSNQ